MSSNLLTIVSASVLSSSSIVEPFSFNISIILPGPISLILILFNASLSDPDNPSLIFANLAIVREPSSNDGSSTVSLSGVLSSLVISSRGSASPNLLKTLPAIPKPPPATAPALIDSKTFLPYPSKASFPL